MLLRLFQGQTCLDDLILTFEEETNDAIGYRFAHFILLILELHQPQRMVQALTIPQHTTPLTRIPLGLVALRK
jgi:hypothetical protein